MKILIIRAFVLFIAIPALTLGRADQALAQTNCNAIAAAATVDDAYKLSPASIVDQSEKPAASPDVRSSQLDDVIVVKVTNLEKLYDNACQNKSIVLFLNDQPIKSLNPYPPTNPSDNILKFILRPTEASKSAWTAVLGRPGFDAREIKVGVGFEDQFPLKPTYGKLPILKLNIIPLGWFALWCFIFLGMVVLFFVSAYRSNIIRDGNPIAADVVGVSGTFSLSKAQGAWWFFVIMAAYLFIGIITGDFSNSINSTALILLGIGAGTVLGAAAIDAQKSTPADIDAQRKKAASLRADLHQLDNEITDLNGRLKAAPKPDDDLLRQTFIELDQKQEEKAQKISAYQKLMRHSEGFLTDILSDANGISFHRYQIFAWTIVLSIIFVKEVYATLAMPTFNTTLMGLLGLSAGTYLGLKIPEPTIPK